MKQYSGYLCILHHTDRWNSVVYMFLYILHYKDEWNCIVDIFFVHCALCTWMEQYGGHIHEHFVIIQMDGSV